MDKKDNISVKKKSPSRTQENSQKTETVRINKSKKKRSVKLDPTTGKLIGVFVFALGMASVIAVLYLALMQLGVVIGEDDHVQIPDVPLEEKITEAQRTAFEQHMTIARTANLEETAQANINRLGLQKADPNGFQKTWVARHRIMSAFSDFRSDGTFEIVLFTEASGKERHYARGQYRYDSEHGILTMQASHDEMPRVDSVMMRVLTRGTFSVALLSKGNQLIWVPYKLEGRRNQLHPLFTFFEAQDGYIEWSEDRR
jgi:hypothetical protein